MATPLWAEKDKDSVLDYGLKLTQLKPGDKVTSCAWTVTPSGVASVVNSSFTDSQLNISIGGGVVGAWYAFKAHYTTLLGVEDDVVLRIFIKADEELVSGLGSALFPNRFTAVLKMRQDRLLLAGSGILPSTSLTDDYLWSKLLAAEADIARTLRVPLAPTKFFPDPPTSDQLTALAGAPYGIDPAQDYGPEFFQGERWGYMITRNKPLISVDSIVISYPAPTTGVFTIPNDWVRLDRKYGHIRLVPASSAFQAPFGAFLMQALGGGRMIPFCVQIIYTAGLTNVATEWPDLLDVVYKTASLKVIGDAFLPSSGSISADGLSQSMSMDMGKYHDEIDLVLNGPKGSNGGLMSAIHGIRFGVLGS